MTSERVAGADGWPGGWVVAVLVRDGAAPERVEWHLARSAAELLAVDADRLGVDVPIGLPDAGRRDCDLEARRLLGGARSSVFLAPTRAVLAYVDPSTDRYAAANATLEPGQRMSRQLWGILPRIADVDAELAALGPAVHDRVCEVHPELSFRAAARLGGAAITSSKKTARGAGERLAALRHALRGVDVVEAVAAAPARVPLDDALDALAAAWSAGRWLLGEAYELPHGGLPGGAPRDARGVPMRMVV